MAARNEPAHTTRNELRTALVVSITLLLSGPLVENLTAFPAPIFTPSSWQVRRDQRKSSAFTSTSSPSTHRHHWEDLI